MDDRRDLLREMLYEKYVPPLSGARPLPPVSWNSWFMFENRISESMLKTQADAAAEAGIEYFCIDAGWFDGDFPNGVGNWTINAAKFPGGLRPIGRYVNDKGMKLGLWFEPERVASGTRLLREHPGWVHGDLLDLGNPEACRWVFQMMSRFIDEGHVQWIRFDFNTSPLEAWNRMDEPDQRGLAQIRHLHGLYALLDHLMAAYPSLLIEGCSSGGRRIDLETIRRAHTFWKSDETTNWPVLRFHQTGANVLLPGQLLNVNLLPEHLPFDVASVFGGPLGFRCDWTKLTVAQRQEIKNLVAAYKTVRPLLNGEYYPLFPQRRDEHDWIGWQFQTKGASKGYVVLLRPADSPYRAAEISLHGLDHDARYTLNPLLGFSGEKRDGTGRELSAPWCVTLPAPASAQVSKYEKSR